MALSNGYSGDADPRHSAKGERKGYRPKLKAKDRPKLKPSDKGFG